MPNQSQEKPPQRPLTQAELIEISSFTSKWTPEQIKLIWNRKMPISSTMDDFRMFLYSCETKGLDPLISEAYCRRQWDSDLGEHRLIIMSGIHGLMKLADSTGQLDGVSCSIEEIDGKIISATCTIHRKECSQPFVGRAYWEEFAAYSRPDVLQYMWRTKPHVMIQKCALAVTLRLAFASSLSGLFASEEINDNQSILQSSSQPPHNKPQSDNAGGEFFIPEAAAILEEIKKEAESTSHPSGGLRESPEPPAPKEEKPDAVSMPPDELKQQQIIKNRAIAQRVLVDLDCPANMKTARLQSFIMGYLGIDIATKDPFAAFPALQALDKAVTHNTAAARTSFNGDAGSFGKAIRESA